MRGIASSRTVCRGSLLLSSRIYPEKACGLAWGLYLLCVVVLRVGVEGGGDGDALEQALLVTLQRTRRLHRPKRAPCTPPIATGGFGVSLGLAES